MSADIAERGGITVFSTFVFLVYISSLIFIVASGGYSLRYPLSVLWGLCGAICVGFSCIYLLGVANLGMSGFVGGLLRIAPLVVLIGGSIGLAGSMLQRAGRLTAIAAGCATLIGIVATTITGAELKRSFGQSEPGIPWYTYIVGIPIGILSGWAILWIQRILTAYLRRIWHRN